MANGNGGITIAGGFKISNEVILYGTLGIVGIIAAKVLSGDKVSFATSVAYATSDVETRILSRIQALSQRIKTKTQWETLRGSLSRYKAQIKTAVQTFQLKRVAYRKKQITLEEYRQAISTFQTAIKNIMEIIMHELDVMPLVNLNPTPVT